MSDQATRLLIVVAIIALALTVAFIASKLRRPIHPEIVVGDVGDRPGVVMFTSTDCTTCKEAIGRLKEAEVPFREVTHELEPTRFETWGVVAVPLIVFLDGSAQVTSLMTGVPSARAIRKAAQAAGISDAGRP